MELNGLAEVLGGTEVLREKIDCRMDLIRLGDHGIPKTALMKLAKFLDISTHQIAELLNITERTIQRYDMNKNFNRIVSEQILQIAEVAARGSDIFGDRNKFLLWMKQPNKALSGESPIHLLRSRFGTELVLDELGRIEYGVFS